MSKQVIALVGAPTDIGAGHRGASMGPEALRVAQLAEKLRRRGLEVIDRGNLQGPINPWQPPRRVTGIWTEVVAWNTAVHGAIHHELQAGRLPIMLGGDHCLAIGSISALWRAIAATGQKAARVVAGCAYRLQHLASHAIGQYPRHAGGLSVRQRPASWLTQLIGHKCRRPRRMFFVRSASARSMRAKRNSCAKRRWTSTTCATSTKWA
jgi:hypothetical protein